jgi:hypothetical protein
MLLVASMHEGAVAPPREGVAASLAVCAIGVIGMLAGLFLDVAREGPQGLLALCSAGTGDLASAMLQHLRHMPDAHAGMLLAGVAASLACRRSMQGVARDLVCSLAMIAGMSLASAAVAGPTMPGLLASMIAGMVAGMLVAALLCRDGHRKVRAGSVLNAAT